MIGQIEEYRDRCDLMKFEAYVQPFADYPLLGKRVQHVLESLPENVQADFLNDSRFHVQLDNFQEGKGWSLVMDLPSPDGRGSRCVVLKPKLAESNESFALYVIAHEFAHAFLHNGPWGDITDPEDAADALAASWGFARPPRIANWFSR